VIVALHSVARPVSSLKNLAKSSSKKEPLENINGCSELDQFFFFSTFLLCVTPMMIAVFVSEICSVAVTKSGFSSLMLYIKTVMCLVC